MNLKLINLQKNILDKTIFSNLNLDLHTGDVCGIIGQNGAGKTTLLKIISEKILPDLGQIIFSPTNMMIDAFFAFNQEDFKEVNTSEDYLISTHPKFGKIYKKLLRLRDEPNQLENFIDAQSQFIELGGYEFVGKIPVLIKEINLDHLTFDSKIDTLSGGERTKLGLINIINSNSDVLILDEPTNHLDFSSVDFLIKFIKSTQKIVIIVSHDRYFLNQPCDKIFDMNKDMKIYDGNYDSYIDKEICI